MAYREGNDGIADCDFVPAWFTHECVHKDFCQCHLVGPRHQGWHHLGALYCNVVSRRHQLFEKHLVAPRLNGRFPLIAIRTLRTRKLQLGCLGLLCTS